MTRITVRLPDDLYDRIRASSLRKGTSLNQTIVDALADAVPAEERCTDEKLSLEEKTRRVREALGDLVVEIDPDELRRCFGIDNSAQRPTVTMPLPPIDPPLSQAIIEEREEYPF